MIHMSTGFANDYGVRMTDGPLAGLCARAVLVLDADDRVVHRELVFEIAFENIQRSSRHKSGVAVRFPRILRQRDEKTIEQADSLAAILTMLDSIQNTPDGKAE